MKIKPRSNVRAGGPSNHNTTKIRVRSHVRGGGPANHNHSR
jgi:hypothetical protein